LKKIILIFQLKFQYNVLNYYGWKTRGKRSGMDIAKSKRGIERAREVEGAWSLTRYGWPPLTVTKVTVIN